MPTSGIHSARLRDEARNDILTELCLASRRQPASGASVAVLPHLDEAEPVGLVEAFHEVVGRYTEAGIHELCWIERTHRTSTCWSALRPTRSCAPTEPDFQLTFLLRMVAVVQALRACRAWPRRPRARKCRIGTRRCTAFEQTMQESRTGVGGSRRAWRFCRGNPSLINGRLSIKSSPTFVTRR